MLAIYLFIYLLVIISTISRIKAIPIDNGVEGEPEVHCLSDSIRIGIDTQQPFEGNVYVKNHFSDETCRASGENSGNSALISIPFNACGLVRERSLEPSGVFVRSIIVISFHRRFLTKVDRAYAIQCFYMEAGKSIDQNLEVSMIPTLAHSLTVPMPVCRYEILDGGPTGQPVHFVVIGNPVYHKWTCDSDSVNLFCMTVYNCSVDDGAGDRMEIIDNKGCSLDRHLLGNLEYQADLMAGRNVTCTNEQSGISGQEAHVFKYADRPNLLFNCQIRITVKEPDGECQRPSCAPDGQFQRRSRSIEQVPSEHIVDVSYRNSILVADIDLIEEDISPIVRQKLLHINNDYCLSIIGISLYLVFVAFLITSLIIMGFILYTYR